VGVLSPELLEVDGEQVAAGALGHRVAADQATEARAVVHLSQVGRLVHDHIREHEAVYAHQAVRDGDGAVGGGAAVVALVLRATSFSTIGRSSASERWAGALISTVPPTTLALAVRALRSLRVILTFIAGRAGRSAGFR
jgi:hypothetical protein